MAKEDKKSKKLDLITDPAEVERVFKTERSHQTVLEEQARLSRIDNVTKKFLEKAASGQLFNIVWHKIISIENVNSSLLRGNIMHSQDKSGHHYSLSIEVDYGKIYDLNPDMSEHASDKDSLHRSFNQQRASIFSVGRYDSFAKAQAHMNLLDTYLMHVLAEVGAENTLLLIKGNELVIAADHENADEQSYSNALRAAKITKAFREQMIDNKKSDFRQVIGNLLMSLVNELNLPCSRVEDDELGRTKITLIFDRDIGEFSFTDEGIGTGSKMKHQIKTGQAGKQSKTIFEGDLTSNSLQKNFLDWVVSAARERELISDKDFEDLYGQITAFRGVPLRTSKLGAFAPFMIGNAKPSSSLN